MAVRGSMSEIIARVRQELGDVASPQDFLDQDIQDVCDAYRLDITREALTVDYDIQPPQGTSNTALVIWARGFSQFQHWEANEVLQGTNVSTGKSWVILSPATAERIVGRWTFEVELPSIAVTIGQYPPVYISGRVFDLHSILGDLFMRRIALRSLLIFDMTIDGRNLRLGQILDRWEKQANWHYARGWTRSVEMIRTDLAPDRGTRGTISPTDSQAGLLPDVLVPTISGPGGS
jgi:hypothetical protein